MALRTKTMGSNHYRPSHYDIRVQDDNQEEALETIYHRSVRVGRCLFLSILVEFYIYDELRGIVRLMR